MKTIYSTTYDEPFGYRSVIFISLLQSKGYTNLINVAGGFEAIQENGTIKTTEYVCPTTLL